MTQEKGTVSNALDLEAGEMRYPRVFEQLRLAGWTETRQVALPSEEDTLGFVLHEYAEHFLRRFNELMLKFPCVEYGRSTYRYVQLGIGSQLQKMDPPSASVYINRIAGTSFVYPIFSSANLVAFVREDAKTFSVDESFHVCASTLDPFQMMQWILFVERSIGCEQRELTVNERPLDYRW